VTSLPLDRRATVLVDVDTQVDFVEPGGALYVPAADTLQPAFARLIRAARETDVPVVASADAHVAGDPELERFPPHCMAGTPGQRRVAATAPERAWVVAADGTPRDERAPGATAVLEKTTFDLFDNPAAEGVLRDTGAGVAVVFGVALDFCVRAAALGLGARGYETVLVADATAPVTEAGGAQAAAELREAGVRFATTDAVVEALLRPA